ncbi:hypothetical protein GEMRC1_011370 [Eukaryota sp. GEM-RC1]
MELYRLEELPFTFLSPNSHKAIKSIQTGLSYSLYVLLSFLPLSFTFLSPNSHKAIKSIQTGLSYSLYVLLSFLPLSFTFLSPNSHKAIKSIQTGLSYSLYVLLSFLPLSFTFLSPNSHKAIKSIQTGLSYSLYVLLSFLPLSFTFLSPNSHKAIKSVQTGLSYSLYVLLSFLPLSFTFLSPNSHKAIKSIQTGLSYSLYVLFKIDLTLCGDIESNRGPRNKTKRRIRPNQKAGYHAFVSIDKEEPYYWIKYDEPLHFQSQWLGILQTTTARCNTHEEAVQFAKQTIKTMTEHDPEDPELERSPPDDQLSLSNCYTVLATGIDPLPKSDRFIQRQVVPFWSEDEEQQFSSSTQKELLFLFNLKDKVEPNTSSFLFGKKFFRKKPQTTNQTSQIQRPRKTPVSSLLYH